MAEDEGADPEVKKDSKKQVKNEHILIGVGIAGLLLTLLFLRKSSSTATTQATPSSSQYGAQSDPYSSGSDYDSAVDDQELADDVEQLQSEITGLTPTSSTVTGTTATTTAASPTTPTTSTTLVSAPPAPSPIVSWSDALTLLENPATAPSVEYSTGPGTYAPVSDPNPTVSPPTGLGGAVLPPGTTLYQAA